MDDLGDKPNAAQSVITIGWPGVDRLSPDYAPLMVMNTLLGASFTSRLNMNLRETHGYTYGASSRFAFRPVPGPFVASAAVRTNVTDSSLVEFFKELRGVRDATVPDDELQRAKAYVELALPGSLESTSQVAASIAQLATFSLPLGELSAYATRVRAITADQFAKALANLDSGVTVIRQGKNAARVLATGADQIGDAMHQHPCLAGTRAGQDKHIGGLPVVGNDLALRPVVQRLDDLAPRFRGRLARQFLFTVG